MQELPKNWQKAYWISRVILAVAFLLAGMYLSYRILLPSNKFLYLYSNPASIQNNLSATPQKNNLPLLYATTIDDFSRISSRIFLKNNDANFDPSGKISVRKSYQAFFYPQGEDITVPLEQSGFNTEDGKLISSPEAVYVLAGNQKFPLDNPITFESLGYDWNKVFPLDEETLSQYEKGKLLNIRSPHPDGTIFRTIDTNKYFYISNGEKREIKGSQELIASYTKDKSIISVSEKSLSDYQICSLKKTGFFFISYSCPINASSLMEYPGKNYEFSAETKSSQVQYINDIQIEFERDITWKNIRSSLSLIKSRIILKYSKK
ncbi:MAG: hypothetical protein M0P97_01780 [Candidatus Moranbacteria bacterium]|jgi:hypothetical protein|nr:hypothetical protein [Candidatus Moranbacteria bacterium]